MKKLKDRRKALFLAQRQKAAAKSAKTMEKLSREEIVDEEASSLDTTTKGGWFDVYQPMAVIVLPAAKIVFHLIHSQQRKICQRWKVKMKMVMRLHLLACIISMHMLMNIMPR